LLFDNETQGSGVYLPELPEPEHCHAHNTMLWELSLLKVNKLIIILISTSS
jgi:nucleolar complex protein 3